MRLLIRGLWWRRGLTASLLAVAIVTTTSAALGPMYARASAESILQDHLIQAGPRAGIAMHMDIDFSQPAQFDHASEVIPRPGEIRGFNQIIEGIYTTRGLTVYTPRAPLNPVRTHLAWRDGQCDHLVIVSGRCPRAPDEAIASQRTIDAGLYRWKLGALVALGQVQADQLVQDNPVVSPPPPIKIVGTYLPKDPNDPFWFGRDYFDARGGRFDGPDIVDTLFVVKEEFFSIPGYTSTEADFDYPLTPGAIRLANVSAERAAVVAMLAQHQQVHGDTDLPAVIDAAAGERRLMNVGTLLVTLQLTLLAWLVLFQVMSDAIEARGDEIAMAKLRGHKPLATIRFGLGQPLVLLALAVPAGLLIAPLLTHVFAASQLVSGVPVVVTPAAVVTALIAFAGGVVAAVLGGYRTLTRSVLDQWRRTTRHPGHSRLILVVDAGLAAAAIAGLVLLAQSHRAGAANDSKALLAPGLLVFAVSILGVRLLPLLCRRLAVRTRASRRVSVFLASRQVSRRPVGLRLAGLLAVAVGLATFGVAGETVASTNRSARAAAELGARRVVTVQFNGELDPVAATRRADPQGKWAMAAATWLPDGGETVTGTVLGVDSSRLTAVASDAAGGPTLRQLAAATGAVAVPPIAVKTTAMRVDLAASGLRGGQSPVLQLNFRTATRAYQNHEGQAIQAGAHTYVVAVECGQGCQLRGLTWDRPLAADKPLSGTITVTGVDIQDNGAWRPIDLRLNTPESWRAATPQGQATDRVTVAADGISDTFSNDNGGYGGIVYASAPSPIPAVATPQSVVISGPNAPDVPAISDVTLTRAPIDVAQFARVLPAVLDNGVIMDVRFLQDELPAFASEATWQVWLGKNAPADAFARLGAVGLQVRRVQAQSQRLQLLGRQAPALALLLLLACAVAGAVLAVGGTAISISASSRRRSYELAALRAVRVSRRSLLRASFIELLLLLGAAVLLGAPTGVIASRIVMPVIPEFSDQTPIQLRYIPQLAPTALFVGAFIVLLVVTAVISARALIRISIPSRLREAE